MMALDEMKVRKTLWQLSLAVVAGDYAPFTDTASDAEDTRRVVDEFPYRLVAPPNDELDTLARNGFIGLVYSGPEYGAVLKLYTAEEGWSDLEMRLTLWDTPGEVYRVRIDDVLVP